MDKKKKRILLAAVCLLVLSAVGFVSYRLGKGPEEKEKEDEGTGASFFSEDSAVLALSEGGARCDYSVTPAPYALTGLADRLIGEIEKEEGVFAAAFYMRREGSQVYYGMESLSGGVYGVGSGFLEAAGLTQERVAERLGKSRPAVANLLRLLTLPEEVQKMLVDGRLTAGHARALVSVDPSRQVQLANLTVQQNWSVRQLERICAQPVKPAPKPRPRPDRELTELEDMARDLFGTRAKIDGDKNRGKLVISYYSADDLQRIWEALEAARR